MKHLTLISILLLNTYIYAFSQTGCKLNEEAKRYWNRGQAAVTLVDDSPQAYQRAVDEFSKALAAAPDCPDIHYNLALCYDAMGVLNVDNYRKAIDGYRQYLSLRPDAEDKDDVAGRIYQAEYAMEDAAKKQAEEKAVEEAEFSMDNIIGNWKFYYGDGKDEDFRDVRIYKNQGNYYVEYTFRHYHLIEKDGILHSEPSSQDKKTLGVKENDGIITFFTHHVRSEYSSEDKCQIGYFRREYTYQLNYEDGMLKGVAICSYNVGGTGNYDYRRVEDAWAAGKGKVYVFCKENCGTSKVYFVKQ